MIMKGMDTHIINALIQGRLGRLSSHEKVLLVLGNEE